MLIIDYINTFFDFVYPRHCYSCNNTINDEHEKYICNRCYNQIKFRERNRCKRCGLMLGPYAITSNSRCISCKNIKIWFNTVDCVTSFEDPIKGLIHRFKYNKEQVLGIPLGKILIDGFKFCASSYSIDMVVPVPLYWKRNIKRGFNQSAIIAKMLSKHFSIPISIGNLCRIRNTKTQTTLNRKQRLENMKNAFSVNKPLKFVDKNVLLVDDVMTTGITASECAHTLKQCRAKVVHLLVLARANLG